MFFLNEYRLCLFIVASQAFKTLLPHTIPCHIGLFHVDNIVLSKWQDVLFLWLCSYSHLKLHDAVQTALEPCELDSDRAGIQLVVNLKHTVRAQGPRHYVLTALSSIIHHACQSLQHYHTDCSHITKSIHHL